MKKLLYSIIILTLAMSCSDKKSNHEQTAKDDFSSPRNLFVDHISSFTGGVISVQSDIRLRLTKNVSDSLVGTGISSMFDFNPKIEGEAVWADNRTIVFVPSQKLNPNQKYEATAKLSQIIPNIDSKKEKFKFVFETLVQNYDVTLVGLKLYSTSDLTKMKIEGTVKTADVATADDIQRMLSAKQNGQALKITWTPSGENNAYDFNVEQVLRGKSASKVSLDVDGTAIGVEKSERKSIDVPALDDYIVMSSGIIRGKENYISVLFSDPIDKRQNLTGLVSLSGTSKQPRLVISSNELKVYPTQEITSSTTLTINQAVKNTAGFQLKKEYSATLEFTQSKPQVRLLANDSKMILPSTQGMVLPFEAVGLNEVDVTIVRIFEKNVLQYLQVNSLGNQSQLNRVARPVMKKTLSLNKSGVTDLNVWNQFTLDLEDILKAEKGALYQIQIGFRQSQSTYFCGNKGEDEVIEELDEWTAQDEASNWDYYDEYDNYNDYNWEERDNPCSSSYYGKQRRISKMLFASDLGIIAKRRDGGDLLVFATNLVDTRLMSGVEINVFDYQQQLIAKGKTDDQGKALIALKNRPFLITAKKDEQVGYLKIDDGSSLSLSNFDVSGTKIKNGLKGFIYGERGVWRPADTVHLAFILEDITNTLPNNHPVVMELYNPNNQLVFRKVSSEPVGDLYRYDFLTASDAPTGNWTATAKVGGASFSKTVKIETIKPNRLKIDLAFDKERFSASDKNISADLNVRWLTGAKASDLKAEYELKLTPTNTTFEGFANYEFDDESKDFYSTREVVFEGRVNESGYAKVNIDLGENDEAPGALTASLYGKVFEEGGDFSISSTTIPYYPYTSFVGLQTPEGDKRGMLVTDKNHVVNVVTLDAFGNPVSRNGVTVELYKLNWRWWWDASYDNISNYVGRSYRDPISTDQINTPNGKGTYTLRIDEPEWGRYYVKMTDPVSGHSAGQVVYLDWPGWAGKAKRGGMDGASMLDFSVEKDEYKTGEKITLSIPSTAGNRVLVSLETGSEILQTFWVETKDKNTNIAFDATPDMSPNIYVHLTMIQPHGQTKNDLPIRLYGVKSVKVVDPHTVLTPQIKMPKELRPEQAYSIEISEKSGKAMAYTIAVVDEGLLDITNYKTPDPWTNFYAREALGIKTWDVYDDVMGAFSSKMDHLLAVGGDGEIQPKEEKEANRFKPVVQFLGPFYLDKGKTAKHNLKMAQYIGSVKTMVIAASDGAYGKAETNTPVKQPLMVLATLPRVAGPGETMKLPVNIFALQNNIKEVSVSVQASGALALGNKKSANVTFAQSGDKVIYFDIKALETLGVGKVKVTARAAGMEASYDIEMNVISRNPPTTSVIEKVLSAGQKLDLNYEPLGLLGENSGTIEISSMPPLNLEQRLKFLIQYPHGCIEQTTSSVFPQLYLKALTTLDDSRQKQIQRNVEAGIKRLKSFQLNSGGFSYWPGNDYASNWGTNYAGHFLISAKKEGYAVPEGIITNWISYQTAKAENWGTMSTEDDNDLIQAYRLHTLALAGSPALGAMNRMKESAKVRRSAKWRLALAYAEAGYASQASSIIEGLSISADSTLRDYRYSFGSDTRDKAMILETLLGLDQKEKAFTLLMDIAKEMGDKDRWMSTQTTAYCFIAISKYAKSFGVDAETNVSLNIASKATKVEGKEFVNQIAVANPDKPSSISVTNNGVAPVYVRLVRAGVPLVGTEVADERNIKMTVRYTDLDGNTINISALPQGSNLKAEVRIVNPGLKGRLDELALTQIFPSGWEIINTRLDGSQNQSETIDYMDIRDDRVMHYFDLNPNKEATFTVLLNASYQGKFYLPAVKVEAMYDNSVFANTAGRWVEVVKEK